MFYVHFVLVILFLLWTLSRAHASQVAYQQRKGVDAIDDGSQVAGVPSLQVYRFQWVFWHVLAAIAIVLTFSIVHTAWLA